MLKNIPSLQLQLITLHIWNKVWIAYLIAQIREERA